MVGDPKNTPPSIGSPQYTTFDEFWQKEDELWEISLKESIDKQRKERRGFMKKNCVTCGNEFEITKHQKTKQYCSELCKPTFKPNYGNPRGRPKKKK